MMPFAVDGLQLCRAIDPPLAKRLFFLKDQVPSEFVQNELSKTDTELPEANKIMGVPISILDHASHNWYSKPK